MLCLVFNFNFPLRSGSSNRIFRLRALIIPPISSLNLLPYTEVFAISSISLFSFRSLAAINMASFYASFLCTSLTTYAVLSHAAAPYCLPGNPCFVSSTLQLIRLCFFIYLRLARRIPVFRSSFITDPDLPRLISRPTPGHRDRTGRPVWNTPPIVSTYGVPLIGMHRMETNPQTDTGYCWLQGRAWADRLGACSRRC